MDALTRKASAAFAVVALSTSLVACGSSSESSARSSAATGESQLAGAGAAVPATTGQGAGAPAVLNAGKDTTGETRPVTATTLTPATTGAGVGRRAVTVGDENSPEETVLGALYAQALAAKGFKVTLKDGVGPSDVTYRALTSGQIEMYPAYTGKLLSAVAGRITLPAGASSTYEQAKAFVQKQGLTLLNYAPLDDPDALATQPRYAGEHGLSSIADLQAMGRSVTLGAPPQFATRVDGLLGLKREYGVDPTFRPIAPDRSYKALETGQVDVQDVSTTAGQLLSGKLELLADPKHVFGFQNVAPVIKQSLVAAEGPAFAQTLNKVSSLLTSEALRKMNAAVVIDKRSPSSVARRFLSAHRLG